jgi:poly(A) polymerase
MTPSLGPSFAAASMPARFREVVEELAPLTERFQAAGHRLYLVGGTVRDLLLGDERTDFDFDATTDALPHEIKACLQGWADAIWTQGERFGTIGAVKRSAEGERVYEITTHRAEVYHDESRKPDVTFSKDIEIDLSRRDFTVNAMALQLTRSDDAVGTPKDTTAGTPTLVDPFGGAVDLVTRTLRTPLAPEISFDDDPLRMLRAARFIARYQLQPVPELVEAARALAPRLDIVSAERIRDELDKLIVVPHPSAGLWFAIDTGLADHFLPELPAMRLEQDPIHRHKDVLTHTLAVVENVRPADQWPCAADGTPRAEFDFRRTRLAALFHDVGKPRTRGYQKGKGVTFHHHDMVGARMTRKRLLALKYSNDDVDAITELVALHLRFHTYQMGWTDSAVRRYVRDAGGYLHELNVLTRCDCTTRNERKAAALSRRMDELEARIGELAAQEALDSLRPQFDGKRVMTLLGIPPGRSVGEAMAFLMEIRLDEGQIEESELEERLRSWWRHHAAER